MKKIAIISMDVEDWYHSYFPDMDVNKKQSLLDGLDVVLDIMNQENIKGSFFVVGEIAEKLSGKLCQMDKDGHDVACHGWLHCPPMTMSGEEYRKQLLRAKSNLENILGHEVAGYRSPLFGTDDAHLDIMKSCGFKYDSSKIKPQISSKYGYLNLKEFEEVCPGIYRNGDFMEFEVSTQRIFGMNMLLGGGYLRMLPWPFMKWMVKRYLRTGHLYVMYIHPIDMSPTPVPIVKGVGLGRYLRTRIGRIRMVARFRKVIAMLKETGYEFMTFDQLRKYFL